MIFFSLLVGIFSIFRAGMILGIDEGRFSPSWRIGRSSSMTNGSVGRFSSLMTRTQSDLICSNIRSFMVDKSPCGKII